MLATELLMLQRSLMSTRMNVDALSITPTQMNLKSVSHLLSCSLPQPDLNILESALHHCMYIYLNPHSVLILLHVCARCHAKFNFGLSCLTHLDYLFRFFLLLLLCTFNIFELLYRHLSYLRIHIFVTLSVT